MLMEHKLGNPSTPKRKRPRHDDDYDDDNDDNDDAHTRFFANSSGASISDLHSPSQGTRSQTQHVQSPAKGTRSQTQASSSVMISPTKRRKSDKEPPKTLSDKDVWALSDKEIIGAHQVHWMSAETHRLDVNSPSPNNLAFRCLQTLQCLTHTLPQERRARSSRVPIHLQT